LLTNLRTLICSLDDPEVSDSINELKNLPESIGNLVNLTKLDLKSHSLREIPESLGNLTKLQYLDIDSDRLWDFRVNRLILYSDLVIIAYREVITNWWNLEIQPNVFADLQNLSNLIIIHRKKWADNNDEYTSGSESTALFITLVQSFLNSMVQIIPPSEQTELKRFLKIQEDFEELKNDYETSLPGDGKINKLPDSLGNLKNLTYLNLNNNNLSRLPITMKGLANTIHTLEISGNPLETLPRNEWFDMFLEEDFDNDVQEDTM
jgi:Leucine-rich repeat (LRR) protein